MKVTNKNRKKIEQKKIEEVRLQHEIFAKEFTKYYAFVACVVLVLFFII